MHISKHTSTQAHTHIYYMHHTKALRVGMVLLLNISIPCPAPSSVLPAFFQPWRKKVYGGQALAPDTLLLPPLRSVFCEYLVLATNPAFLWLLSVSTKHVNNSVTPETSPAALPASQATAPTQVSLLNGYPPPHCPPSL